MGRARHWSRSSACGWLTWLALLGWGSGIGESPQGLPNCPFTPTVLTHPLSFPGLRPTSFLYFPLAELLVEPQGPQVLRTGRENQSPGMGGRTVALHYEGSRIRPVCLDWGHHPRGLCSEWLFENGFMAGDFRSCRTEVLTSLGSSILGLDHHKVSHMLVMRVSFQVLALLLSLRSWASS